MNYRFFVAGILCVLCFTACVNTRKTTYFNQSSDTAFPDTLLAPATIIQKSDILSINISSVNPEVAAVFNGPNVSFANTTNLNGSPITVSGYLVNPEGDIQFPVVGRIRAEGINELQLQDRIAKTLVDKKLLVDPVVTVRHLNFKVTVLGEVAHPLVINVPNEKITLLEALGLAGDITIYGKRDQVLLIRHENNQRVLKHIDLNTTMLFLSPYYYLQANDVIYVEPNKARVANSGRGMIILPALLSGLSFIAIIVDRATR